MIILSEENDHQPVSKCYISHDRPTIATMEDADHHALVFNATFPDGCKFRWSMDLEVLHYLQHPLAEIEMFVMSKHRKQHGLK